MACREPEPGTLSTVSASSAPQADRHNNRALIIEAAREALESEDARAERLDAKARGQMTLAGAWFAVVQAVAAVALKAGMPTGWLVAVAASAGAAAIVLVAAMIESAKVWKLKSRPSVGTMTIDAMTAAVDDDEDAFRAKMVQQYQHLLGKLKTVNFERAEALQSSMKAWWCALGLGLVELAVALLARILGG